MQSIEVFSVRDLRLRSSELVRDAEAGQVSIITKRASLWCWRCHSVAGS